MVPNAFHNNRAHGAQRAQRAHGAQRTLEGTSFHDFVGFSRIFSEQTLVEPSQWREKREKICLKTKYVHLINDTTINIYYRYFQLSNTIFHNHHRLLFYNLLKGQLKVLIFLCFVLHLVSILEIIDLISLL